MRSVVVHANAYAARGLHCFPVNIDKAPCTPNGFYDATTDGVQLVEMFDRSPTAGVAIRTGRESGVFVVDVDPRHGGNDSIAALEAEHGPFPTTAVVLTGGDDRGCHLYFAWPTQVSKITSSAAKRLGPGVDIKATGGYVVAPPSPHRSGHRYEWASVEIPSTFSEAPDWLVKELTTPEPEPAPSPTPAVGDDRPGDWFNQHGEIRAILTEQGWVLTGTDHEGESYWRRPGKPRGTHSATFGFRGGRNFYVFSSNASPFEPNTSYSPFAVLARLTYAGDFSAAARALVAGEHGAPTELFATPTATGAKSQAAVSDEPDWEPPIPLVGSHRLPTFPADALPDVLTEYVVGLAHATQTPLDLPAGMVLATLAAAAGGRAVVEPRPGWREPANLFVGIAMPPGNRKSAVVQAVTAPLHAAEKVAIDSSIDAITEAQVQRSIAEERAKHAAAAAARATLEDANAGALEKRARDAAAMVEAIMVPVMPRLLADDTTPEALASLLAAHGGRLAMISAEGGPFDAMAGRYSKVPNLDVYLKGHAGDHLRIDRQSRKPEVIESPALTVAVAFQPGILPMVAKQPGFRTRGLLARFLFAVPSSQVGRRQVGALAVDPAVTAAYEKLVTAMVLSLDGWTDPCVLRFSPEANDLLLKFERELEPRLGPDGDLGPIADWGSKLAGAVVRVAGLLHLVANLKTGYREPISAETFTAARAIGDYFLVHAIAAHKIMGADPATSDAVALVAWIRRNGQESFSIRDAHHANQSRFPKVAEVETALELLERHGWVRRRADPSEARRGRPPSPVYDVNPTALDQDAIQN